MKVPVCRFTGIVYRAHHPMWAYTPLSGEGAKRHGGRFNRPGSKALYKSLDPTTACMEAQQGLPFKSQPMTLMAYQVDCADIADLKDPMVQRAIDSSPVEFGCAWEYMAARKLEPSTWLLADRLQTCGVAGILVRSYAPGCSGNNRNLVLWQWSNSIPYAVQVIDDLDRLPKTRDSWHNGESD